MAIYLIIGESPDSKKATEFFVRAPSLQQAVEFVHRSAGLNKVDGKAVSAEDAVGKPIVNAIDAAIESESELVLLRQIAASPLIRHPVLTIALGMFLGSLVTMFLFVIITGTMA